ncbi:MAG TPA: cytochrome-c oxidase, cbb3-type subunit III [Rhodanobacteraceae bacterium]|nr:cytochrome-c oxidase, cbb3-type subunit III [Rhodanobacteraceae bacterium]
MSTGWSLWVMFLVVLNMGITFALFLWAPRAKVPKLPDGTTGHVWAHGTVREGLADLPLWWIVMSAAMFVSAFIYLVLYPGFGNHKGTLEWSSHKQLAEEKARVEAPLNDLMKRFALYPVEQLARDPATARIGKVLFEDNCAACHGRDAKGNHVVGAPNLTDGDWLYGGSGDAIYASIHGGRSGVMPPWASLGSDTVKNLAQYVLSLSGSPHDSASAALGKPAFATCAACHGPDGKGNQALGAPNLTDRVWLYGGGPTVEQTIADGRQGHMPAWDKRLSDPQIRVLAAYVYHLSQPDHAPANAAP